MTNPIYAPLQLYTTKELAALYGINEKTMRLWIKFHRAAIGPKPGHLFSILQVEIIFRLFGWPQIQVKSRG